MDISRMLQSVKNHPSYHQMGMIASHVGVVRETSLKGHKVKGVEIAFHPDVLEKIREESKQLPGVIEVLIETQDGRLNVGDDIMMVMVGGDTREHVFPALIQTVDRIKKEGATKKEIS